MMRRMTDPKFRAALAGGLAGLVASPAFAASGPFFSLQNTDFVVLLAFLIFIGILLYAKVPSKLTELLDRRAEHVRNDLAEARRLREDAQKLYADYERRQREVSDQADEIVANAKREAQANAEKAKADLQSSIERRLKSAEEQISAAENDAVRAVRDTAVNAAIAASAKLLREQSSSEQRRVELSRAIDEVEQRLH